MISDGEQALEVAAALADQTAAAAADNATEVLAERLGSIESRARVSRRFSSSVDGPRIELVLDRKRVVWSCWFEAIGERRVERHARWHVAVDELR